MNRCTRLLSPQTSPVYFVFVSAVLALTALDAGAQSRSGTDVFQKASFKRPEKMCAVESSGAVTALIKNGVELSVNEDWDCDGVPDAYDNCVGIVNPSQADANGNGIGDSCEAAATVTAGTKKKSEDKIKKPVVRSRKTEEKKSELRSRKSEKKKTDKASHDRDPKKPSRKNTKPQRKKR
jgi:hypothetical protein